MEEESDGGSSSASNNSEDDGDDNGSDIDIDNPEAEAEAEEDTEASLLVEQYASQLLDFSGQYGSEGSFSYAAINCLGKPTKFPSYGMSTSNFLSM